MHALTEIHKATYSDGLVTNKGLVVRLDIGNGVLLPAAVSELVHELTHLPILIL